MSRRGGQVCSPSFPLPPRVKHFPAKDALADKIENYAGVSRGRQKKRKANAAKFLQRLIFCSSQTDGLVCVANAYILTLINCAPDACGTDYEMREGREIWNYWGQNWPLLSHIHVYLNNPLHSPFRDAQIKLRMYSEVQLDFTPEMKVFYMPFKRCHTNKVRT